MKQNFLTAEWRKLAIANYVVDESILRPFVPFKTEIDKWKGLCYVSLVGFRFINTRVRGFSIPFHTHFEEINLRFYVRYKENDVWKRGSEAEFITEHYWGYTPINDTCCSQYEVQHPRWKVYEVRENLIDVSFERLYGTEFAFLQREKPVSVMLAEGSEITVCAKQKIV